MIQVAAHPPTTHEVRAERRDPRHGPLEKQGRALGGRLQRRVRSWRILPEGIVSAVDARGVEYAEMDTEALREAARDLRLVLRRDGFLLERAAQVFALVRETADRTVGMRHFDCQLMGGWVLLNGMVAEMETGEGKTLTATLPAVTAALAGIPVHVVTVNDYLTARDAEWMGPVYETLGLTVGTVVHGQTPDQRQEAYASDITYGTNKELVFDYLRDRLVLQQRTESLRLQADRLMGDISRTERLVLRGLHYAIVDEADSVLVDEARTPLIISGGAQTEEAGFLEEAAQVARGLEEGRDYRLDLEERRAELTEAGMERIREQTERLSPLWAGTIRREETVRQALMAFHLFERDVDYLVREGKVVIVDEFTGRLMPDRSWERGLHQLIEIKEGVEVTLQRDVLSRISYQRFFRRYLRLAGMTGTASEVAGELGSVYGLPVIRIPTNRPVCRTQLPDQIHATSVEKWEGIVARVGQLHDEGRPCLIGTRSVAASEHVHKLMEAAGLPHQVLNAKFDKEEAEIIARAGERGRVTVATNMAGRGTDIKLGPGVAELGGLHVILTERHEARRIDRQLQGRSGRQGDPGSSEAFLSLEDPLVVSGKGGLLRWIAERLLPTGSGIWSWFARGAVRQVQKRIERLHARMRRDLLKQDDVLGTMLSFTGRSE